MIQSSWKEVRDRMTIKEFAQLCSCNAQTLRYYDKIDLLKPVKVDPWSGYRYYEPAQAIDFVKIKNLQAADFTIDEIKVLLTKPDQLVYEAFDRKIAEQTQKLERIRKIQQSYLTEKSMMEKIVYSISNYILSNCTNLDALREFGFTPEDAPVVLTRLKAYLDRLLSIDSANWDEVTLSVNGEVTQGGAQVLERLNSLTEENLADTILLGDTALAHRSDSVRLDETAIAQNSDFDPSEFDSLWERHGWEHVYEFLNEIPALETDRQFCFWIQLTGNQYQNDLSFSMFMLGAMLLKYPTDDILMGCAATRSPDGENHFSLLRKK